MPKQFHYFITIFLILTLISACSRSTEEVTSNKTQPVIQAKLFITSDEFNKMFKKDEQVTQYKEGKFELMDGTIVNADYFSYGTSYLFNYAVATFYKGELANLHLDTTVSIEEIEEALGLKFEDLALVEKTPSGYTIIFDSMFHDTNISVFPYEWE